MVESESLIFNRRPKINRSKQSKALYRSFAGLRIKIQSGLSMNLTYNRALRNF